MDNETVIRQFTDGRKHLDVNFLEYSLPVLIQSGGNFTVNKFQVDSTDEKLNSKVVYMNLCTKYCDMSSMASRTLLVNPNDA